MNRTEERAAERAGGHAEEGMEGTGQKFTVADKDAARRLRTALVAALATIEQSLGVKIEVGAMSFDRGRTITAKLSAVIQKEGEATKTTEALEFERYADMIGLKKDDLGQTFTASGKRYTISGMRKGRAKMPILATREDNGKTYSFPVYAVLHGFGRISDAEAFRLQSLARGR